MESSIYEVGKIPIMSFAPGLAIEFYQSIFHGAVNELVLTTSNERL